LKLVLLDQNSEDLTLKILSNSRKRSKKPIYVACFSGDSLLFHKEIARRGTMKLKVETDVMLGGINRFILLNEELIPVSERLVFLDNLNVNELDIKTNHKEFSTRSQVRLEILDDHGLQDSALSSLSVAVVNENSLISRGDHQHMASYFFLDSELKGYIESPAEYFIDDEHITSKDKLNLLMLTHGWCNYVEYLSEINADDFKYQKTAGITIKGNAERVVGKKPIVEGAITVGLFKDSASIFLEDQTDSNGWFSIDSLFFFDTVTIFAQVLNERGKQRSEVYVDTEMEEKPRVSSQLLNSMQNISDIPLEQHRQKYYSDVDYHDYHPEGGSILLEEVEIKRRKVDYDDERFRMYLKDDGDFRIYLRADDVLKVTPSDYHHTSVLQFLKGRVAGFSMNGGGPILRGAGSIKGPSTPLFILDGMLISEMPMNIINSIPMSNIDRVEVLKGGSAAIYGSRGNNGVIAVYTKKGETPVTQDYELVGAITKKVMGFSSNRKFYSPQYTPENINTPMPDHRTTLYWNPKINIENGKATLSFYTADDLGYFRITVEGATDKGQICYGTARFMVDSHHN
jgi:TonB-dependent SusC/RagA subfamily outer membrane receptor